MHKKYVDLLMLFTTLYIQRQQQNEIINGTPQYIVLIILINDIVALATLLEIMSFLGVLIFFL